MCTRVAQLVTELTSRHGVRSLTGPTTAARSPPYLHFSVALFSGKFSISLHTAYCTPLVYIYLPSINGTDAPSFSADES
jgi:hypothetical protein